MITDDSYSEEEALEAQREEINEKYYRKSKRMMRYMCGSFILGIITSYSGGSGYSKEFNPHYEDSTVIQYQEVSQTKEDMGRSIGRLLARKKSLIPRLPVQIEGTESLFERAFFTNPSAFDSLVNRYQDSLSVLNERLEDFEREGYMQAYREWNENVSQRFSFGLLSGGAFLATLSLFGLTVLGNKIIDERDKKLSGLEE